MKIDAVQVITGLLLVSVMGLGLYKGYNKDHTVVKHVIVKMPETRIVTVQAPVIEPEKEYVVIDTSTTASDWINPDSIPKQEKKWKFNGDGPLAQHIEEEHGVKASRLTNWTNEQLINLHSYCHNGGTVK